MLSFGRTNARGPRRRASRVSSGQELKASSARPWASASSSWVAASGSCQPSGTSVEESSAVIGAGAESSRRSSRLLAMTLLVSETRRVGLGRSARNHAQTGPMGGPETRHESLSSNQVAERQESGVGTRSDHRGPGSSASLDRRRRGRGASADCSCSRSRTISATPAAKVWTAGSSRSRAGVGRWRAGSHRAPSAARPRSSPSVH
jgi:hypothetical protein